MAATTVYEVRGNHPDATLRFFPTKGEAQACQKESPKTRLLCEYQVFLNAKGVAENLNLLLAWQDDGMTGKVEAGDKTRVEKLRAENATLRALVMEVYEDADMLTDEEVEAKLAEV